MKQFGIAFFLSLLIVSPSFALTASWQPNTEPDMKEYGIYACKVKGCTVQRDISQRIATVPHPTVKWALTPDLIEGSLALTAIDTSGNESPLSNQAPFDLQAPKIPAGVLVTK
jgi:hypothetical protein